MNTPLKVTIAIVAVIAVVAVLGAGFAFAQGMTAWGGYGMMSTGYGSMGSVAYQNGTPTPGYGMMGGNGMMNGQTTMNGIDMNAMHQWMSTSDGMHTLVWNSLAEALNLTPQSLNSELSRGKTLTQVAAAQGVSQEQLAAALKSSVTAGLDQAVTDGALTREQADLMLNQMSRNFEWMLLQMGNGNFHENSAPPGNS